MNKNNSTIFNKYNQLHELTDKLDQLDPNLSSIKKKEIISHNSKYWVYNNIINLALLFKNNTIYFPTFLDFRGRIYPTPNYLSYQSNDLARSLLLFEKTADTNSSADILEQILKEDLYKNTDKKMVNISEIDYLKIYLANVFGKNKLSRKGRIKWVDNNIEKMIRLYEEDIDLFNTTYVNSSKEPFQFVSSFLAYYKYIKSNKLINIPILFDATCSGIQHLSALSKDTQIAKLVNLLDNETPSDFYQYCIDEILNMLKNEDLPNEIKLLKEKLDKLNINRKWLKQSIMTIPYNVTNIGIADKLSSSFDKLYISNKNLEKLDRKEITLNQLIDINSKNFTKIPKEEGIYILLPPKSMCNDLLTQENNYIYFTSKEILLFATIIKNTVINIIPSFNKLKVYFDQIISILQKIELPIFWETPSGMSVSMSIVKMTNKRIKNNFLRRSKPISLLIPTDQINYKQIKTGLMPNFIHSLDASNIHLLIKNINKYDLKNINLYTIHDCFASDVKNIKIIELLVKHSFIQLYFKDDYLNKMHNSFLNQIRGYTEIFKDSNKDEYYILIKNNLNKSEKLIIPNLPKFEWIMDKNKIKSDILYNLYFIS